tara:strand:- start:137 stop:328 length:192 start_codon:yes stop_codon:yes gene_type:complete
MDETAKTVIAVIVIALYLIGISLCAYYMSAYNNYGKGNCCKCIKKYNFFGDRVDEEPRIYFEV